MRRLVNHSLTHCLAIVILLAMGIDPGYSQNCNLDFTLGNDTTIDCGSDLPLTAPAGYTYFWNTGATTQSITVSQGGTYSVQFIETQNSLVTNGDFSAGDTGFSTEYIYGTGGSYGILSTHDQYALAANANDVHNNFADCFDHTTGDATGMMLLANGAAVANKVLWSETVTVFPNTDYVFSVWGMSAVPNNPADIQLLINGSQVGDVVTLPSASCVWTPVMAIWNSGSNTSAELSIVDDNTALSGNDFAIDDITFSPTCIYSDTIVVSSPAPPTLTVSNDTTVCGSGNVTLSAYSSIPGSTFLWQPGALQGSPVTVAVNSTQLYTAIATSPQNCVSNPQTLLVIVTNPGNYSLDVLPATFAACENVPVQLSFTTATNGTYSWEPAEFLDDSTLANPTATVDDDTEFTVTYTNICGDTQEATTTVIVGDAEVDMGPDLQLCEGSDYTITLPQGPTYIWQDGSTGNQYTVSTSGTYSVDATIGNCTASGSITIEFLDNPELVQIDDATICEGESYNVNLPTGQYTYLWEDGSTSASHSFTDAGTYSVTAFLGDCDGTTSFDVTVNPLPVIDMGAPTFICEGATATLSVDFDDSQVTWSNGESGHQINVTNAGTYTATVTQNNCSSSASTQVMVSPPPTVAITGTAELCDGDNGTLTATSGNYSYLWNNDSTQNPLTIHNTGTYTVTATDLSTNCVDSASFKVSSLPSPEVTLNKEMTLCEGKTKQIIATPINGSDLVWDDGTTGIAFDVTGAGVYSVTATTVCGSVTKSIDVTGIDCTELLYIPNSFTPDGDGINDIFKAVGRRVTSFKMKIFNRWGQLVFSSDDISQGWNGDMTGSGYYVPNGVYAYIVQVEYESGNAETKRGSIQVIR